MRRSLPLAVLLAFCACAVSAETQPVKFHLQLIYATNSDKPLEKGWKKIGPKLRKALSPVFQWKEFWEVNRTELVVPDSQAAKTKLTEDRDLEIRFQKDGRLELLLYRNAKSCGR